MQIKSNFQEIIDALDGASAQIPYASMLAINKTAEQVRSELKTEMVKVFDRPTPWTLNSLRILYATKSNLVANMAFKDRPGTESTRSVLQPNVFSGRRHFKSMEAKLLNMGVLAPGWNAVPGANATIDAYGNMSQSQITQILNVLGEATASSGRTIDRLAKGNKKRNIYGFAYFVNPVQNAGTPGRHLAPGVYRRVITGFGTSLKPVLIFVKGANYKSKLDFFGISQRVIQRDMQDNFRASLESAIATKRPK